MKTLLNWMIRKIFRVEVENLADFNCKKIMVVANYHSLLDGLFLHVFLPVKPTFVVQSTIMKRWYFRWALSLVNHLVIDISDPLAMKKVADLINKGVPVVIFPEGKMTATGRLMKLYNGAAFVAEKIGADIIPVWISGTINSKFSHEHGNPRLWFPPVKVYIGKNEKIILDEENADKKRELAVEKMRDMLQNTMFKSQPKDTVYSRFLRSMKLHGKHHRILEDQEHIANKVLPALNYKEVLKRALAIGRIMSRKTQKGDAVGVMLPNVSITPSIILGLNVFGRIPAMLNYTIGSAGVQAACETANVKIIMTSRKFLKVANLQTTVQGLTTVEVIYLEDLIKELKLIDKMWLMLNALPFASQFIKNQSQEDPAVILFTSGSEAKPKGVVLSNRAIVANVDQIKALYDMGVHDKVLNAMPLFHSFGLTGGTMLPLLSGTPVILYPSPLHYKIIPEVSYDMGCTVLFGTNTFLLRYAKNAHPYDFIKMRYVVAGAEKLTSEVRNLWNEKFGIRVFEGYGATECSPVISVNAPIANRFGTVGQFLPGIEYRLKPVDGVEEGGELHVKGPNIMSGYMLHTKPGVIQFPDNEYGEGWYNTGDVVNVVDGFVTIKGRMKRFVKIAGEMVPLETVEKVAITTSPDFAHAVVVREVEGKESVVLYTTDKDLKRENLSQTARSLGLTDLMVSRDIRYIEIIPLLGTGKTDYVLLKKMACE